MDRTLPCPRCASENRADAKFCNDCGAALSEVFVKPQGLVEAHRLPPVRHGECRIELLRLDERRIGVFVLEVVKGGDTAKEVGLRRRGSGGGKDDRVKPARLRREVDAGGQDQQESRGPHADHPLGGCPLVRYQPRDHTCRPGRVDFTSIDRFRRAASALLG